MYKRYQVSQEALLETERLMQEEVAARAATTQEYDKFVEDSEKEAIAEREENKEEDAADDLGTEDTGEEPLSDSIEEETPEPEATMEAFHDWISDKTRDSDSSVVRGAGAMIAGLSRLGITYGPALLNFMFKGVLWSFSRLGTLLYDAGTWLKNYIESSRLSLDKLEARLKAAEKSIVASLNAERSVESYTYKNRKVISYLKVGKSLDVASNLRVFANNLAKVTASLANEAETGVRVVEKIAASGKQARDLDVDVLMEVSPPGQGFVKGSLAGYENLGKEPNTTVYHTEPIWPGDMSLIYQAPSVKNLDIEDISKAYRHAKIFVGASVDNQRQRVEGIESLSGHQLVMVAKSAAILLGSCRGVSSTQQKLLKLNPSVATAAQKLFYDLADTKAKRDMENSLVIPLFLRSKLATETMSHGSAAALTHASRVLSAAIQLLEDHAAKLNQSSE